MPRIPDPKVRARWLDRVRRQQASGLTVVQFCTQEGIARSKLNAWKRRFRLENAADLSSAAPGPSPTLPARPAPPAFLPVEVRVLPRGSEASLPVEADLPNGVRLRIPTSDPGLTCRLLRALARATTGSGGAR